MEEQLLCEGEINRGVDMNIAMELSSMHPLEKSIAPAVGFAGFWSIRQSHLNRTIGRSIQQGFLPPPKCQCLGSPFSVASHFVYLQFSLSCLSSCMTIEEV